MEHLIANGELGKGRDHFALEKWSRACQFVKPNAVTNNRSQQLLCVKFLPRVFFLDPAVPSFREELSGVWRTPQRIGVGRWSMALFSFLSSLQSETGQKESAESFDTETGRFAYYTCTWMDRTKERSKRSCVSIPTLLSAEALQRKKRPIGKQRILNNRSTHRLPRYKEYSHISHPKQSKHTKISSKSPHWTDY